MYAFLLSTAVIFVAELGDKSQLMAMTFAARYRARDVLIAITAATALVHLASVGIGRVLGNSFADQQGKISLVAGVAFLGFALWTLRGDELRFGTWVGSTVGMVAADALAIWVGMILGRRLPEKVIKIGAAIAFAIFGVLLIVQGVNAL